RGPRSPTPFPYPTLFRSNVQNCPCDFVIKLWSSGPSLQLGNRCRRLRIHDEVWAVEFQKDVEVSCRCFVRHGRNQGPAAHRGARSEEHTSEFQSRENLVC